MALCGLVPAPRYDSLAQQFDEAHHSAHTWKTRAGEALARVKSLEGELERQARLLKETRSEVEKRRQAECDAATLRDQLGATQKELVLAREHLMAIEVKLDILEGAANVLDARTRVVIRQPAETSAEV